MQDSHEITDERAEKLFAELKAQPPFFDEAAVREISAAVCPGPTERIALFFLARPFKDMVEAFKDRTLAADFAHIAHLIDARLRVRADFDKLLETAQFRIRLALCEREDMQELLEEARNEREESNVIPFPSRSGGEVGHG